MADLDGFARECKVASRQLRRLPKDLRRELGSAVKIEVAEPLADRIGAAWRGPHARALQVQTKARAAADPQVVVGGTRRVVSGGASARQLVYGNEFGGGKRVTAIPSTARRRGHRRRTTRQFARPHPAVFPTISRSGQWVLDQFAKIVDEVLGGVGRG